MAAHAAQHIVSIPDVHGDLQALQSALQLANLTDAKHNWRAPAGTVLVQTGDLFDRGDDAKAVVSLLQTIEAQAAAAGSTVHRLLGNHDVMNLMGDLRYVTPGDFASFGGHAARAAAFARDGPIGAWLLRARVCVHVGDTLFVHAGIAERFAALGCDQINARAAEELARGMARSRFPRPNPNPLTLTLTLTLTLARTLARTLALALALTLTLTR